MVKLTTRFYREYETAYLSQKLKNIEIEPITALGHTIVKYQDGVSEIEEADWYFRYFESPALLQMADRITFVITSDVRSMQDQWGNYDAVRESLDKMQEDFHILQYTMFEIPAVTLR